MKRTSFLLIVFAAVFVFTGCASVSSDSNNKKIKTAFYIDTGSRGGGVLHLARLLSYSPQVELTMVNGKDLRDGKLDKFDLIVMPGGSSRLQMNSMAPAGVEALRKFVQNGGAYIGICAGCHIALNRPERARLLPYKWVKEAVGAGGDVPIDISPEGAELLDIPAGRYVVRYSMGPILEPAQWDAGLCKSLAAYKGSIGPIGKVGKSFYDTPAMIYGNFGKGKVIATSFHPEYKMKTYPIFSGCFYAVTGVKLTPEIPQRQYRPLRVAYHFAPAQKKNQAAMIKEAIELEKCPELGMQWGFSMEILDTVDLLILPDGEPAAWQEHVKAQSDKLMIDFMKKGGKIIAVGDAWKELPDHDNLTRLKSGASVVDAALDIAD